MRIVNLDLALHPMNWLILFLMVFIAGLAGHLILSNLPTVKTTNPTVQP